MKYVYVMPHPPIIMEEIGGYDTEKANSTVTGMTILAKEIASLKPQTIVFVTPHGNSFSNGTCLLDKSELKGDFGKFGHAHIGFTKKVNRVLTDLIHSHLEEKDIISVLMDEQTAAGYHVPVALDHGVMVPMYFIDKYYSEYDIVHITPGFTDLSENYEIGQLIQKAVEEYIPQVSEQEGMEPSIVFIASGDLSHALSNSGPYPYHVNGPKFDEIVKEAIATTRPMSLIHLEQQLINDAAQCGLRSILMGFGYLDGYQMESKVVSYEGPFGVGYLTGMIKSNSLSKPSMLEQIHQQIDAIYTKRIAKEDDYIALARAAINHYVTTGLKVDFEEVPLRPEFLEVNLNRQRGAFVSIHKQGQLRGCIGTIEATADHLIDEIIYNGISACSKDPRFHPIEVEELKHLEIKVDILYPRESIESESQLDVKEYGVIVEQGYQRGLLLPNLEGIDTVEEQISIAKRKAGIISGPVKLYRFKVERHEVS